jgi:hypothetical protein
MTVDNEDLTSDPSLIESWDRGRLSGPAPYEHPALAAGGCRDGGRSYAATEFTRPSDPNGRAPGLDIGEGFYLDLLNSARHGEGDDRVVNRGGQSYLEGVPSYTETQRTGKNLRITYWFFYALSEPPGPPLVTSQVIHEGDWERISVRAHVLPDDHYEMQSVRFFIHNGYTDVGWSNVQKAPGDDGGASTHPIVYSARGSHATYPEIGNLTQDVPLAGGKAGEVRDVTEACAKCPIWQTWMDLVNAKRQPWYGFGGAWGEYRAAGSGGTGPSGPSTYKSTITDDDTSGPSGEVPPAELEGGSGGG